MKYCPKCKTDKELSEFHNDSRTKDGKVYACKDCINAQHRSRWHNNESIKKKRNANRAEHRNKHLEQHLLAVAKRRANKKGIEFAIEELDIIIPKICPVLSIPIHRGGSLSNAPSLDRKNANLGYVKGNVQVISHRANTLKSNGTIEEFEKLIKFLKSQNSS